MEQTNVSYPDHLCVLIHGLWGTPVNLANVVKTLRERYPKERLNILISERNSGYFTYDGIETCGERVCKEIEEELEKFAREGQKIKKLSIVGYSLGGLVARYVIGVLYSRGIFDQIEAVNFTTFATPHLGVRTPLRGLRGHMFNVFVARTLSKSGRQLFLIDNFRETGRPLLAILADQDSVFIRGLALFKRRTLYANIVHDRSAVYYTTAISGYDPYADLDKVELNYLEGYGDVILNPSEPVRVETTLLDPSTFSRFTGNARLLLRDLPLTLFFFMAIPIGALAFLVNSVYQTMWSTQRIRLHESGKAGIEVANYRTPLLIAGVRGAIEDVYENLNSAQSNEYLTSDREDGILAPQTSNSALEHEELREMCTAVLDGSAEKSPSPTSMSGPEERIKYHSNQMGVPLLALTPDQFAMIRSLDEVGWRKYPVYIHNDRHSHAAIIVRKSKNSMVEGYTVLRHWLDKEFSIE